MVIIQRYGCNSKTLENRSMADDLISDLSLTVQTDHIQYIKNLTTSDFPPRQSNPEFSRILMNQCSFMESPCLTRLFGHKLNLDIKRIPYIRSMLEWLLIPYTGPPCTAILLLYSTLTRARSRQKLDYCCHIWAGAAQSWLSSLDRDQYCLCILVS